MNAWNVGFKQTKSRFEHLTNDDGGMEGGWLVFNKIIFNYTIPNDEMVLAYD